VVDRRWFGHTEVLAPAIIVAMTDDRRGERESQDLDELARAECLRLMATAPIGRIAVITAEGLPMVVPVNFVLDGETILFRTDPGTKVDALRRHPVAFQADQFDPVARRGWSVLVQGVAHEVSPDEVGTMTLEPWVRGERRQWVRVVPRFVTGRRIGPPD
jgi:nitroimidazol reductase NimA-like FMN-containing flavoprotein (pyridoxamine 5'-phosphate oxidase superfamily)